MSSNAKRDYYEVLGVKKDSSADEVRKSYRKVAFKFHPDRNPGDKAAEESFKEATEAYEVLSDEQKRKLYDAYGHAGLSGQGFRPPEDIFEQFQDLFADFFGGGGGGFGGGGGRSAGGRGSAPGGRGSQPSGPRPQPGRDVRTNVRITLREAVEGVKRDLSVVFPAPCNECGGTGAAKGTQPVMCRTCQGRGQVAHGGMGIMIAMPCNDCGGAGQVIQKPCGECRSGEVRSEKKVKVVIPAGIDHGQVIRVRDQGEPGRNGAPAGSLLVVVEVEQDERFHREGNDLIVEVPVAFTVAALGGRVVFTGIDEKELAIELPAGTQPGTMVKIRNGGVPNVEGGRGRGNLVAVVRIDVPRRLSDAQRVALMAFQQAMQSGG